MNASEHLRWSVERAMQYANAGEMTSAWTSFGADVRDHEGTAHIANDDLFAVARISGLYDRPDAFRRFVSAWAVRS